MHLWQLLFVLYVIQLSLTISYLEKVTTELCFHIFPIDHWKPQQEVLQTCLPDPSLISNVLAIKDEDKQAPNPLTPLGLCWDGICQRGTTMSTDTCSFIMERSLWTFAFGFIFTSSILVIVIQSSSFCFGVHCNNILHLSLWCHNLIKIVI